MRTSSFSSPRVVDLLNAHFVPVYTSNEDYRGDGAAPPEERAELRRIQQEGYKAKLSVGTVHAYVLSPDGHPVDSRHVAQAAKPRELVAMLEAAVKRFAVPAGKPLLPPAPQSAAPKAEDGGLVLHVVARSVRGAGWGGIPGENWVAFDKSAAAKLLPEGVPTVGQVWRPDRAVLAKVLTHFYPETENNDADPARIDRQEVTATVVSVRDGVARARLGGRLRMKHNFYHKDDGKFVEATLVGYLDFDTKTGTVRALRLVTETASYGAGTFAVAARSLP